MDQVGTTESASREQFGMLASRRRILQGAAAAAAAIAAAPFAGQVAAFAEDDEAEQEVKTVLRFGTMAGIHPPFLGDAGLAAFRGVHGGGAPWVISEGVGSLRSDGRLRVRVRGLVLDPAVHGDRERVQHRSGESREPRDGDISGVERGGCGHLRHAHASASVLRADHLRDVASDRHASRAEMVRGDRHPVS